jgi:hypothetical protein
LTIKNELILALFDGYFWPFNQSHKKSIPFCDQLNQGFNLKYFYQILLTWSKTYIRLDVNLLLFKSYQVDFLEMEKIGKIRKHAIENISRLQH